MNLLFEAQIAQRKQNDNPLFFESIYHEGSGCESEETMQTTPNFRPKISQQTTESKYIMANTNFYMTNITLHM